MRKNKSLSSTSTAHFDTSSKPVQSYAKNARLSITNKISSEGPSSPHDNYRNGLQSQGKTIYKEKINLFQAEKEITNSRDYKLSRAQNTPVSEKDLEHRNSCHSKSYSSKFFK